MLILAKSWLFISTSYWLFPFSFSTIIILFTKLNVFIFPLKLKRLGISPNKDGFHYLRKAIYECYINPTIRNNYTELYTILENTFSISRKDVERSIRYSIFVGYTKSDYEYFEKLFSNILTLEQTQPKNSEFIAIVLEELFRIHHKTIY